MLLRTNLNCSELVHKLISLKKKTKNNTFGHLQNILQIQCVAK